MEYHLFQDFFYQDKKTIFHGLCDNLVLAHLTSVRSKTLPDKILFRHMGVLPIRVLGEIVPFVFLVVFRFYVRPAALRGFNYRFADQTFGVRLGGARTCATCGSLVARTFAE